MRLRQQIALVFSMPQYKSFGIFNIIYRLFDDRVWNYLRTKYY
jgi:hypothetical protein